MVLPRDLPSLSPRRATDCHAHATSRLKGTGTTYDEPEPHIGSMVSTSTSGIYDSDV